MELDVYNDKFTPNEAMKSCVKLASVFPTWDSVLTQILLERAKANKFTNKRLEDAINHTIDTCKYPCPSISEIISYNKKVKLYSHIEMTNFIFDNGILDSRKYFKTLRINGKCFWVKITDYESNIDYFKSVNLGD